MKFLIVGVFMVLACQALPHQKCQQQKTLDQQFETSDQDYKQPINLAKFSQPQQQLFYKQEDFKSRDSSGNTAWIRNIRSTREQQTDGRHVRNRRISYETGNNIIAEETGYLQSNAENENPSLVQQGSYTYISPEGETIAVSYTADEFGF